MNSTITNILIAVGALAFIGLGYFLYQQQSAARLSTGTDTFSIETDTQIFIQRQNTLDALDLSSLSIFDNPQFSELRSHTIPLPVIPTGKPNPFAVTEDTAVSS